MSVRIADVIRVIEEAAPRALQEQWDNSGFLVGDREGDCNGVMLCLDVSSDVIAQAKAEGCNLVISHHPLIFKGVKEISRETAQGRAIIEAIKADVAVYSAHTSLDNAPAPWGVSRYMAELLGAEVEGPVTESGTGVYGTFSDPMTAREFIARCLLAFSAEGLRHSCQSQEKMIEKVVLGGGSCGFLIPNAIKSGADAIVTSDVRYHDFLDYGEKIFIVDLTHFDTEKCTKEIFKRIISQKIPKFAPVKCAEERNPIEYK